MSLRDALILAAKVLLKTMDSTQLGPDKLEFATLTRVDGRVRFHFLSSDEIVELIDTTKATLPANK